MYDDLVKRLRNRRICIQQLGTLNDYPLLGEAADAIELLQKTQQPRWIPVSERLPELGDIVLLTDGMDVGDGYLTHYDFDKSEAMFSSPFADLESKDITHWMPLPTPPKGEEE